MKVMSLDRIMFASNELLPATCTSKPQVSCKAMLKPNARPKGYSNEEIYDALVAVKNFVLKPFKPETKLNHTTDYLA